LDRDVTVCKPDQTRADLRAPGWLETDDPCHRDAVSEGQTDALARDGIHRRPPDRDAVTHLACSIVVEVEALKAQVAESLVNPDRLHLRPGGGDPEQHSTVTATNISPHTAPSRIRIRTAIHSLDPSVRPRSSTAIVGDFVPGYAAASGPISRGWKIDLGWIRPLVPELRPRA
jgi:hypothetical protein